MQTFCQIAVVLWWLWLLVGGVHSLGRGRQAREPEGGSVVFSFVVFHSIFALLLWGAGALSLLVK